MYIHINARVYLCVHLQHDIAEVMKILKVRFAENFSLLLPSWSAFDSAMLCPLRFQVNGSLQVINVQLYAV